MSILDLIGTGLANFNNSKITDIELNTSSHYDRSFHTRSKRLKRCKNLRKQKRLAIKRNNIRKHGK